MRSIYTALCLAQELTALVATWYDASVTARKALQDFVDLLSIFNRRKVKYIIVGAHAMSHWGYTRATGDLDVLIATQTENVKLLLLALKDFGAPISKLKDSDFQKQGYGFQIGVPPLRIDILTSIDGVHSEEAFRSARKSILLDIPVRVLDLPLLITNKLATGRAKDKNDVAELKKLRRGHKK